MRGPCNACVCVCVCVNVCVCVCMCREGGRGGALHLLTTPQGATKESLEDLHPGQKGTHTKREEETGIALIDKQVCLFLRLTP